MNRFYQFILFLYVLPFIPIGITDAATWVEDFNTPSLRSWVKHDKQEKSTWQPEGGKLDVWIQPPPPPGVYDLYALQFVGFEFEVDELNVQLKFLEKRNTSVGILLGQYDGTGEIYDSTIIIIHTDFHGKKFVIPERFEVNPIVRNEILVPLPPNVMEISFDRGDFEVFGEENFSIKYNVPQLRTINCIGIASIVGLGRGVIAHFVLDDFVVSGPDVPKKGTLEVRPNDKVTVLWGDLKQR